MKMKPFFPPAPLKPPHWWKQRQQHGCILMSGLLNWSHTSFFVCLSCESSITQFVSFPHPGYPLNFKGIKENKTINLRTNLSASSSLSSIRGIKILVCVTRWLKYLHWFRIYWKLLAKWHIAFACLPHNCLTMTVIYICRNNMGSDQPDFFFFCKMLYGTPVLCAKNNHQNRE